MTWGLGNSITLRSQNRFAALENINDSKNINRACQTLTQTSAKESPGSYELKQHKPWFDDKCSRFLDQRKKAKNAGLQDPFQSHIDNLYNVRCEANRHCSNKKWEYLKAKINELELGNNTHESKFHLGRN